MLESSCARWHHPQGISCGDRDMRSVLTGFPPAIPYTYTDPCPALVLQPYNAAYFFASEGKRGPGSSSHYLVYYGVFRGRCPAVSLFPPHANSRRHLVQLAVKVSQGTGCQTCAAGDCWLGASSKFGTTQREPTHISAGALPSSREKGNVRETQLGLSRKVWEADVLFHCYP